MLRWICLSVLAVGLLAGGTAIARDWVWYKNEKFDNALELPKDLTIKTSSTADGWAQLSAISQVDAFEMVINAKTEPSWTLKQTADRMARQMGFPATAFAPAGGGANAGLKHELYSAQGKIRGRTIFAILMVAGNGPHRYALFLSTPVQKYELNKDVLRRIATSIRPVSAVPPPPR